MESQIIGPAPTILAPVNAPAQTPDEAAKGHSTVTMVFEKQILFTVSHGHKVLYPKGVHEVPREWANHWYLEANGARLYNRPISLGKVPEAPRARSPKKASAKK
jgi:hypothetical protein